MKIILASNSPRRKELLAQAGLKFEIYPSSAEEREIFNGESVTDYAVSLATTKATSVYDEKGGVVIGADTIVVLDGEILKKPKEKFDAINMLNRLSGKAHSVITGYAVIYNDKLYKGYDQTLVIFNELSSELINSYIESNLWKGKAGGYGIQDGYPLVKEISGNYDTVVGLPTNKILNILSELK